MMELLLIILLTFVSGMLMGGVCVYLYFSEKRKLETLVEKVKSDSVLNAEYLEIRERK